MAHLIRFTLTDYFRSYRYIPPLTIYGAWVFILYAYKNVPVLSSYSVSSMVLYFVSAWIAMSVAGTEEGVQRQITLIHAGSRAKYLFSKAAASFIVTGGAGLYAIVLPILLDCFDKPVTSVHLVLAGGSHLLSALMGILAGLFFSTGRFAGKATTWLSLSFVLLLSLAYKSLEDLLPGGTEFLLLLLPPEYPLISLLGRGDDVSIDEAAIRCFAGILVYLALGFGLIAILFKKQEIK